MVIVKGMQIATVEQQEEVTNDLVEFVHRVALDKNATPTEIAALPEVAKVLCGGSEGDFRTVILFGPAGNVDITYPFKILATDATIVFILEV